MSRKTLPLGAVTVCAGVMSRSGSAQSATYKLVPDWPTLPPGTYFGLKDAPPPPAEREAMQAARRARGGGGGPGQGRVVKSALTLRGCRTPVNPVADRPPKATR